MDKNLQEFGENLIPGYSRNKNRNKIDNTQEQNMSSRIKQLVQLSKANSQMSKDEILEAITSCPGYTIRVCRKSKSNTLEKNANHGKSQ